MSSDKTLNQRYWDYDTDVTVGVVKIVNSGPFGLDYWYVFTPTEDKNYLDWQTAIKVAYGERTP